MPNLAFTTTGTSIFDWFLNSKDGGKYKATYERDIKEKQSEDNLSKNAKKLVTDAEKYFSTNYSSLIFQKKISAEIITLNTMLESKKMEIKSDAIILLHSDTLEGKLAAELNQSLLLEKTGFKTCELKRLNGVKGNNAEAFQEAVNDKRIDNELNASLTASKYDEFNPLICFSGGYKGVIPVLSNFAKDKKMEMYYLYETSDKVIKYSFTRSGDVRVETILA